MLDNPFNSQLTVPENIIPMVIETSPRGERAFDIYSLLLKERTQLWWQLATVVAVVILMMQ